MNKLQKDELIKLLKDTFDDIKAGTDYDSKTLSDFNTTFNWLLTLTTVFFVYVYRLEVQNFDGWFQILLLLSKIGFIAMIIVLLAHKILSVQYEDFKNGYIKSLFAHKIDLTYNYSKWSSRVANTEPFSTLTFKSNFIDGLFIVHPDEEQIRGNLKELKEKFEWRGVWIKRTYRIGIGLSIANLLIIAYFLFA